MKFAGVVGRVRRAAHMVFLGVISGLSPWSCLQAANVTLAWDDSTADPTVAGYRVYYGLQSRTVTNYDRVVEVGPTNSVTIANLNPGITYWFAATTFSIVGLESDFSSEISYSVPNSPPSQNQPPTLDPITDIILMENAGQQTVSLSGISSGSASETQTLAITALSSNPQLIPTPTVSYTSPQPTGTLSFRPATKSFGVSTITVLVDDGASVSNSVIRAFTVTVNTNAAPTLDPIPDLVIEQNSGAHTVALSGIGSGSPAENQPLAITATSDNQALIPDPLVAYTSPNSTATLTLRPTTNSLGSAVITVQVSDGQPLNGTFSYPFKVTLSAVTPQNLLTNTTISPNQLLRFVLNPPVTNGHKFNFTLAPGAPAGTKISVRKSIPSFVWTPTSAQASTTNLILIRATDTMDATISTNLYVQVTVRDYMSIMAGTTSVEAGQKGSIPLSLTSSEGVTNLSFLMIWPAGRFGSPTLSMVDSNTASGSLQIQGTNVLIKVQALPRQVLEGSNAIAVVGFQATAGQSSAFVSMPIAGVAAVKPGARSYDNMVGESGEIVVVGDVPLLRSTLTAAGKRELILYGKVGSRYDLQFATSLASAANWSLLSSYAQTNISQTVTVNSAPPLIFYRLKQQ